MNSRKMLWLSVPLILAGSLTGCSRSVDHSGNLKVPKLNEVIVNGDRNLDVNNRITVIEARKFIEEGSMAYLNDNYIAVYYPNTKEVQARTIGLAASNLNEMNNIVVNGNVYNAVRNVTFEVLNKKFGNDLENVDAEVKINNLWVSLYRDGPSVAENKHSQNTASSALLTGGGVLGLLKSLNIKFGYIYDLTFKVRDKSGDEVREHTFKCADSDYHFVAILATSDMQRETNYMFASIRKCITDNSEKM